MASLQSTLGIAELRLETLKAWFLFIHTLRYIDTGPFIGPTTAALVTGWVDFKAEERSCAVNIVDTIAGNKPDLLPYIDDIVGLDSVPQFKAAHRRLFGDRKPSSLTVTIDRLLEKTGDRNIAVSTTSIRELRNILISHSREIYQLSRGDTFSPLMSRIVRSLLSAVTRDSDCEDLLDIAYDCFGYVGALDPDRFKVIPEDTSMAIVSNFADPDESYEFAVHLIKDLLVGLFRATNDKKNQTHLA
jgi:serine/threonine-protein kinase ATR